jgi:tetratricopeptide (TPR) repeat protein
MIHPKNALSILLLAGPVVLAAGCQDRLAHLDGDAAETVLLVTIEGLGAGETGAGGNPDARTPHLDRLARRGVQAREARPVTTRPVPALACVLTGRPPADTGLTHEDFALRDGPTLADVLGRRDWTAEAYAGCASLDGTRGLAAAFARLEAAFPDVPRSRLAEPWRDPAFRSGPELARRWADRHSGPRRLAWFHLGEATLAGPRAEVVAAADHALGAVLRARPVGRRTVTAVVGTGGATIPFVLEGPGVPVGRMRDGLTLDLDVAPYLAAAAVAPEARANALRDPPADRERPPEACPDHPAELALLLDTARALDRAGRLDEARRAWERAIETEPSLVAARARAAELAARAGDPEATISHATALLERVPDHPEARVLLARALAEAGDDRAVEILEPVLATRPDHSRALALAGELALRRGDLEAAGRQLRHALAAAGDDPVALLDAGRGLSRAGRHAEAVAAVTRALERGDRSAEARYTLARVLEGAERYPEAVQEYSMLLRDHPDHLPAYRNLGALMARDGEVERAIELWERGLERFPDDPGLAANVKAAREALGLATLGG